MTILSVVPAIETSSAPLPPQQLSYTRLSTISPVDTSSLNCSVLRLPAVGSVVLPEIRSCPSPLPNWYTLLPSPPFRESLPVPPTSVSAPSPPYKVSLPSSPPRTSLPPRPDSVSLPAPPRIVSLPVVPLMVSAPSVPPENLAMIAAISQVVPSANLNCCTGL